MVVVALSFTTYVLWIRVCRWQINCTVGAGQGYRNLGVGWNSMNSPPELMKKEITDRAKEKELSQKHEWFGYLMRFRNDTVVILSIICLQLPIELAYAHLFNIIQSDIWK